MPFNIIRNDPEFEIKDRLEELKENLQKDPNNLQQHITEFISFSSTRIYEVTQDQKNTLINLISKLERRAQIAYAIGKSINEKFIRGIKGTSFFCEETEDIQSIIIPLNLKQKAEQLGYTVTDTYVEAMQRGIEISKQKIVPEETNPPKFSTDLEKHIEKITEMHNREDTISFYKNNPLRFGVSNAEERFRQGKKIAPIIKQLNGGNLLAIRIDSSRFIVFPKFGLGLDKFTFNISGIGELFECPNYDPSKKDKSTKVIKPAIVRGNENELKLPPLSKGILDIQY
jgi:hypothetical protein